MARMGTGFFDAKGHYFKTPDEATISDLSAILGKIGDGESLAPGIAHTLLHRRSEIEQLFTDHDRMLAEYEPVGRPRLRGWKRGSADQVAAGASARW